MTQEAVDLWGRALRALQTARAWAVQDPDAAASRAYYAAYYAVSALFAYRGMTFRRHSAVQAAVHRDLVNVGTWSQETGAAFSWLLSLRQTGDYGGEAHVTIPEAQEAVRAAETVIQAVRVAIPEAMDDNRW
jgi:uncharacterized protein (UPF0332 family)